MKKCPVCQLEFEDLYVGLCPGYDCMWEFELASEMTPEMQKRYLEKLEKAKRLYERTKNGQKPSLKEPNDDNDLIKRLNGIIEDLARINNTVDSMEKQVDEFCKKKFNK